MRHNAIRDLGVELLREVYKDGKMESKLLPVDNLLLQGNNAEKARFDVSAVEIWSQRERTFIDVRIKHGNSPSYLDKTWDSFYT